MIGGLLFAIAVAGFAAVPHLLPASRSLPPIALGRSPVPAVVPRVSIGAEQPPRLQSRFPPERPLGPRR